MFDIAEDQGDSQRIKQLSVFLPNRVGALLGVTRSLHSVAIRILALSIADAADHAVARLVVDRPALALEALESDGYAVFESDLIGVALPEASSDGIRQVLSALLLAELNVHYVYSLLSTSTGQAILALCVEDADAASRVLLEKEMELIGQDHLT